MYGEKMSRVFAELNMPYRAVAVKFCRNRPSGYEQYEGEDMFCGFLKYAQDTGKSFYIAKENEKCMGSVILGFKDMDTNHGSGQVGALMGAFKTPAANARLYYEAPMLKPGMCNFVVFAPVETCTFNPDLVVCVCDTHSAWRILHASSYISGDPWESKCSYVMSCSWTYVYPYITGKVNHLFTGMHMGLKIKKLYPEGLHILSIPYQKLDEIVNALDEMDPLPINFRTDDESVAREKQLTEYWKSMENDIDIPFEVK